MEKRINIKSLELVNFKGIRNLKVDFGMPITEICGRNGSGKTTVFDAFTYVLFGKDSHDRKDFNIKTLDENNRPIPRIPHEVICVLDVNGEEITLKRCYSEKWTKRRGSAYEEFTGHEEERYYNGVPCSVREYNTKVASICEEAVFKFITNPLYFTAQKTDVQRTMLFRMAGGVSDEDVAKGNIEFEKLISQLTGKTMDEYKREIQAKKRRIKSDVDGIPARIDERRRDVPEAEDWAELERQIEERREEMSQLDAQLMDISKANKAKDAKQSELYQALSAVVRDKSLLESRLTSELLSEYHKSVAERAELEATIKQAESDCVKMEKDIERMARRIDDLNISRQALLNVYNTISKETLEYDEREFTCPTCGRKYDVEEIESRQQEISERFNKSKADRLMDNILKGKEVKAQIEQANEALVVLKESLAFKQAEILGLKDSPILSQRMAAPDVSDAIRADKRFIELSNKELDIRNQIDSLQTQEDDSTITTHKNQLLSEISDLSNKLGRREVIARNEERIASLEAQLKTLAQELAELEGIEYTIAQFGKAKVACIEERVNAMFQLVSFKMFEQQINGGEVETCEAMVSGVPFSDLNNAMKINAGLDIINAICRFEGVYAPIFIDNAESVNTLLATESQSVRLTVTEDVNLNIQ